MKMMTFIIVIVFDNISIYFVINDDKIGHDCHTDPVAENVEAGKNFFHAAIYIAHFNFEARLAVHSDEVDVNNKKHPAQEKYNSYRELDTEQYGLFIKIGFNFKASRIL